MRFFKIFIKPEKKLWLLQTNDEYFTISSNFSFLIVKKKPIKLHQLAKSAQQKNYFTESD